MNKNSLEWGFSLLEVLIALVILSLAFISIYGAISSNSRSLLEVQNKTAANWVALNAITEAKLGLVNISENGFSTVTHEKMFKQDWEWTYAVEESELQGSYKIRLQVKQRAKAASTIVVLAYLRKPA